MKYHEQVTMENNSLDYLLKDLNDTGVESSLEDLNDAQLKQISGGQSSSSSSITISSDGSGSYSIESFTSGNASSSGKLVINGETIFNGAFPSGAFSLDGFF